MRLKLCAVICVLLFLPGCSQTQDALDKALALRSKTLNSEGCRFNAEIHADYGDEVYVFTMACEADKEGNLSFSVLEPYSIAGITGNISNSGGNLIFDDSVLAFQTMADGLVTPVTAPWLLIKTLRNGYLNSCIETEDGLQISIDDSYEEDALHLNIWVNNDQIPVSSEIFWQGRRVLVLSVEEFVFL